MRLRLRPLLSLLCLACLLVPARLAASKAEIERMSPEEVDRLMAAGTKYEFTILNAGEVLDPSGTKVAVGDLKKHLKKGKYDKKAFYVLWLSPDLKLANQASLEAVLAPFDSYGASNFVVRRKPSGDAPAAGAGKTVVLKGKPNPKSLTAKDPLPAFADRAPELRPERLPARVRYRVASDAEVTAAAALARAQLLDPAAVPGPLFGDVALVNPGAWQYFRNDPAIGHANATPTKNHAQLGSRTSSLDGMMLRDGAEIRALETALHHLVQEDGGGELRAMRSAEMDHWWTFIGFDIEEPVFVLETKNKRHRFVLSFNRGTLFILDELNGLPGG